MSKALIIPLNPAYNLMWLHRQIILDLLRGRARLDDIPALANCASDEVVGVYQLNALDAERGLLRRISL